MKIRHIILGLISLITLFTSCVGEDVVVQDSSSLNFERRLFSLAADEQFTLNLVFRDQDNQIIEDQSNIDIQYSSDNTDILTIDDQGVITVVAPNEDSTGTSAKGLETNNTVIVRVNASIGDFIFDEITDEIIIGAVTISEGEALAINEDEIDDIVNNGFDPVITITNPINEIGLQSTDTIQFNGIYQNFKNQIVDVVLAWESDDTNVIQIDTEGTITPIAEGSANIIASFNSNGSTTTSEPLSISVSPGVIEVEEVVVEEAPIVEVEPEILGFGMMQSNSFYDVSGNFQIIRENGITTITLDDEYATGNVPDLVIYLSNVTNTDNGAAFISEDITSSGEQSFIIPDTINPDDYINVLIYCRRFGARVGFGVINR